MYGYLKRKFKRRRQENSHWSSTPRETKGLMLIRQCIVKEILNGSNFYMEYLKQNKTYKCFKNILTSVTKIKNKNLEFSF